MVFLLGVVGLSACQATIQTAVDVKDNGSGSVTVTATLDKAAAAFASDVQLSGLAGSGWTVAGPTPASGGAVTFTASKGFATPAQAQVVMAQLSGAAGPFHDLTVISRRTFFRTTAAVAGRVDLSCGLACFADPQLQQALGGSPSLGIDPSTLQGDAGVNVNQLLQFVIAVRLPGTVRSNAPSQAGGAAHWPLALGQQVSVMATSKAWNVPHLVALAVAAGLALLAVTALVVGILLRRRRRRRESKRAEPARSRVTVPSPS